jgi:hypothetical protein
VRRGKCGRPFPFFIEQATASLHGWVSVSGGTLSCALLRLLQTRDDARRDGDGAGGLRAMIGATRRMLTGQSKKQDRKDDCGSFSHGDPDLPPSGDPVSICRPSRARASSLSGSVQKSSCRINWRCLRAQALLQHCTLLALRNLRRATRARSGQTGLWSCRVTHMQAIGCRCMERYGGT